MLYARAAPALYLAPRAAQRGLGLYAFTLYMDIDTDIDMNEHECMYGM